MIYQPQQETTIGLFRDKAKGVLHQQPEGSVDLERAASFGLVLICVFGCVWVLSLPGEDPVIATPTPITSPIITPTPGLTPVGLTSTPGEASPTSIPTLIPEGVGWDEFQIRFWKSVSEFALGRADKLLSGIDTVEP